MLGEGPYPQKNGWLRAVHGPGERVRRQGGCAPLSEVTRLGPPMGAYVWASCSASSAKTSKEAHERGSFSNQICWSEGSAQAKRGGRAAGGCAPLSDVTRLGPPMGA